MELLPDKKNQRTVHSTYVREMAISYRVITKTDPQNNCFHDHEKNNRIVIGYFDGPTCVLPDMSGWSDAIGQDWESRTNIQNVNQY